MHETFNYELKNYLEWTEKQRIFFKDSINWWMTELAGRNNLSSDFFLYICQIKSLKKIINSFKEEELLIVSDDILLIKAIISNLDKNKFEISYGFKFAILKNLFHHYFILFRNWTISFLDFYICFFAAKITYDKKKFPVVIFV